MKKIAQLLLSFSKAERIGLAILIALLALFIILPYLVPRSKPDNNDFAEFKRTIDSLSKTSAAIDEEIPTDLADYQKGYKGSKNAKEKNYTLFAFDPNTADIATFEQLGFSPKQAAAIVNYRSRGAVFRSPDDFKKVFVVSDEHYDRLKPYIQINSEKLPVKETVAKYDSTRFQRQPKEKIELNSADTAALQRVRGIGAYTAIQIANYREQLGGFASIEQLREIRGMTDERFEQIVQQLELNTTLLTFIDLHTADENMLKKHPYIGAYDARGILRYRKAAGDNACTLDALVKNNVLKAEQAAKLQPYCKE